ncbi:hypothetical protein ABIB38_004588 [Massilia sp. UYP11]|uniref:hypothetical protein n=1 Tax=Massilia sp. UYP11 TaxID=1756385 RepID=UPI003D240B53
MADIWRVHDARPNDYHLSHHQVSVCPSDAQVSVGFFIQQEATRSGTRLDRQEALMRMARARNTVRSGAAPVGAPAHTARSPALTVDAARTGNALPVMMGWESEACST